MFTQSAFIRKNTPELREKLEKLGYKNKYHKQDIYYNGLHISEGLIVSTCSHIYGGTDCGTNEALFLAIAALRDDSDYMQVYTNGEKWVRCDSSDFNRWYIENHNLHKATKEELINHFK